MKVVHIITGLGQGGAEAMLERLLRKSRECSPQVAHEVISLRDIGVVGQRLRDAGVTVRSMGMTSIASALRGFPRLLRALRAEQRDVVVQTWMYHGDLVGGLAARLAGRRKLVWNVRQSGLTAEDISAATRLVVKACASMSRWLPQRIVFNASAAMTAHQRVGYDSARFMLIPNGFDLQRYARHDASRTDLRAQWGFSEQDVVIGLVARLDPQKDHPNFLLAAARVAQALPCARFLLVGRGVPASPELRSHIATLGLGERVVLQDERQDIPSVMSAIDVFCLSSRAEGFPNVLGEAMACETPSVSTDCGDARLVLGSDELVAPTGDPQALAECVLRLARLSPGERRHVGTLQRQRIAERFSIASVWAQYSALYTSL
jgi:glycosyltransferase involved in cell wall biosynthesis